jgi:hypothetical protein
MPINPAAMEVGKRLPVLHGAIIGYCGKDSQARHPSQAAVRRLMR